MPRVTIFSTITPTGRVIPVAKLFPRDDQRAELNRLGKQFIKLGEAFAHAFDDALFTTTSNPGGTITSIYGVSINDPKE